MEKNSYQIQRCWHTDQNHKFKIFNATQKLISPCECLCSGHQVLPAQFQVTASINSFQHFNEISRWWGKIPKHVEVRPSITWMINMPQCYFQFSFMANLAIGSIIQTRIWNWNFLRFNTGKISEAKFRGVQKRALFNPIKPGGSRGGGGGGGEEFLPRKI